MSQSLSQLPGCSNAALLETLLGVPFFQGIPVEEIDALAADLKWMSVPAGWTLFAQGEMPDALYLVISGRLGAFMEDRDGSRHFVGEISANQLAGEMALLTQEPRSATVIALRNTTLVRCRLATLQTFMREHRSPQLMLRVVRVLATRLARSIARNTQATVCGMLCTTSAPTR